MHYERWPLEPKKQTGLPCLQRAVNGRQRVGSGFPSMHSVGDSSGLPETAWKNLVNIETKRKARTRIVNLIFLPEQTKELRSLSFRKKIKFSKYNLCEEENASCVFL